MKKSKELKKTICVTIESKQERDLKSLSKYTGLNVSEVVRKLLPSAEDIDAFITYQDYTDKLHRERVFDKIANTRPLFMEIAMSGHILAPIGLQVSAVSFFDKTGAEIPKLFKRFIRALQSIKGCRFERVEFALPKYGKEYFYYVVTSRDENKKKAVESILKYFTLGGTEVQENIKRFVRVKRKKRAKRKPRKLGKQGC